MKNKLDFILGPCVLESYDLADQIISELENYTDFYFKASFDKANRSSNGFRGPGLKEGIEIFKRLKEKYPKLRITTDVHEVGQLESLSEVIDLIQIPAFLCRQTDLIVEASKLFKRINIKKGQWMSPYNMVKVLDKIDTNSLVYLTERGSAFGTEKLIVDFSTVEIFKEYFDKVFFDVTHSTHFNKPNGRIGGDRLLAKKYFKAAYDLGYDGIFAEVHPDPDNSLCDSESTIELDWVVSYDH